MKKKVFGVLLLMETAFLFISAIMALCYGEKDFVPLIVTMVITGIFGFCLFFPSRKKTGNLSRLDCYIIISGVWVIFSLFGMLPFLLYGTVDNVTDAFFETMSGFTTTGASILNNIDEQPHGILFWRSILQWLGGLGIMVFSIALLPSYSRNNKQLFSTEVTSVSMSKVRPKTQETARGILIIYVALTLCCAFFYFVGPMNLYDSICHAMVTLGTGGFGTHQANMAYFHSSYIEYVCSIFMLMGGVNFALYFYASTGNWKPLKTNEEFRWYICATIFFVLLFFLFFLINPNHVVSEQMPTSVADSFRAALFHVTSIFTSCGFQGTYCDYDAWGAAFWMPTMLMMVSGACAGSTSGGMKLIRFIICIKNTRNEFLLHKYPNAVLPVKISKRVIDHEMVTRTLAFIFLFIIVVVIGTTALAATGLSFDTAFGCCISAISNTGPGFGEAGPYFNFSTLPAVSKWILSGLMLIGRLEIYTVLLMFTVKFWRE